MSLLMIVLFHSGPHSNEDLHVVYCIVVVWSHMTSHSNFHSHSADSFISISTFRPHDSIVDAPVLTLESNPDLLDPKNHDEKQRIFRKVKCRFLSNFFLHRLFLNSLYKDISA